MDKKKSGKKALNCTGTLHYFIVMDTIFYPYQLIHAHFTTHCSWSENHAKFC